MRYGDSSVKVLMHYNEASQSEGTIVEKANLKVPFGLNAAGREVRPETATKEEAYYCPDCKGDLVLRKGDIKIPHFAHKGMPVICDFLTETEEHYRAKLAVAAAIHEKKPVRLVRQCHKCKGPWVEQSIPDSVKQASLEHMLPSGHRADVALLDDAGHLLAVIEILVNHRVDDEKAKALEGTAWAEFPAGCLGSLEWKPCRDFFNSCLCERCKAIENLGFVTPFVGRYKTSVQCPLNGGRSFVEAVAKCSSCEHFVDVCSKGIFCIGRRTSAGD